MNKYIFILLLLFLSGCSTVAVSPSESKDFYFELTSDQIDGHFAQSYSAHNADVDNSGSKEDIWEGDGLMTYLTTAQKYNITSTDADDTVGGTGGQLLILVGLNSTYDFVTEFINLDGTNTVQSVNEFIRPRVITAITAGSTGYNEGTITAISADTGDLQLQIDAEESTSKNSHFTVPRGHTAFFSQGLLSTTKTGGQTPIVEFKGKIRINQFANASWIETFDVKIDTEVNDHIMLDQLLPNPLVEKTDFRIEVTTTHDNTDVNARLSFIFIED